MPGLTQTYQHYCWNSLLLLSCWQVGKENIFRTKRPTCFASVFCTEALCAGAWHVSRDMELITCPQSKDRWLSSILSIPESLVLSINWLFTRDTHHSWLPTKATACASPLSLRPYHVRRLLDGEFQPLCWGLASRKMCLSASVPWLEMPSI